VRPNLFQRRPHSHNITSFLPAHCLPSKQLKTARNGKNLENICKDFYTAKTP
jgi:hypothetical protein